MMMCTTNIRAIAHSNSGDTEPFDSIGVPPVGTAKELDFLIRRQLADQVGDGGVEKAARHELASSTGGSLCMRWAR